MLNKVAFVGRLTKDVELRFTADNQTAVAKFTIAVDRTFKRDGQPTADFIPIIVFGKQAENSSKFIGKGRLVAVSGRIQTRSWDDKEGKKHYATEVIADEVDYLDKPKEGGQASGGGDNSGGTGDFHYSDEEEDDLPF